jgi:hypothetical protein
MLELCPCGHETNKFFLFLFLQRLPTEVHVLLSDDEDADSSKLAVKADQLWAMHAHRQVGIVAIAETAEEPVAVTVVQSGQRFYDGSSQHGHP